MEKRDQNAGLDDARCEGTTLAIAAATYEICARNVRTMHGDRAFYAEVLADSSQKARHSHAREVIAEIDRNLPAALERKALAHADYTAANVASLIAEATRQPSLFGDAK